MGYRLSPPPDHRIHIDNTATPTLVCIDNGTVNYISIPCLYDYGNIITRFDVMKIDHDGWPSPDRPDASWQPAEMLGNEIDLADYGYTGVHVAFQDPVPEGLEGEGYIDRNIIRIKISCFCYEAQKEDIKIPFAVFVYADTTLASTVTKGILHVAACPVGISAPDDSDIPDDLVI